MRFAYPAELRRTGTDEIVVSFRDLPECLTSGVDEADALAEAADALDGRRPHRRPRIDSAAEPVPCRGVPGRCSSWNGCEGGPRPRVSGQWAVPLGTRAPARRG